MPDQPPKTIRLADYTPPDHLVDEVDLRFDLDPAATRVVSRMRLHPNPAGRPGAALVLDGQDLRIERISLNEEPLGPDRYRIEDEALVLPSPPKGPFTLEVVTRLHPAENTSLEGLYRSGEVLCTQCEAEGFRKMTYFPDRPDVMTRYTTTLAADRARYPVLLSNGNPVASGRLEGGRHWVRWEDPYPKPSYLFALVAGDLAQIEDQYITRSGRTVTLRIYVEPANADKCEHAMRSLQQAMAWDERVFGLEYDLDIYMIVAVDAFNMGAMENKGLNLFNSKYVLARPDTATDQDYLHIQGVIAHEYFHNWTGNRVTCRDWFQLSLKEGLTVFRDQEFSSDMGSRAVKRIEDVRLLRTAQFAEDAGPMAHPVRPSAYIEINNFYTLTVYEKGAELIRMIHTLLGAQGFRRGLDLYFERHDGQAVTTDDFVQAMQDASGVDLGHFRRWYEQAGTPEVVARGEHDAVTRTYTLRLRQSTPPTPGQTEKPPLHIPLALGLLGRDGRDLPLRLEGESEAVPGTRVVSLHEAEEVLRFVDVPEPPVPSLFRGFSAPIRLDTGLERADLAFLMAHDADPFNRWDAGQELATQTLLEMVAAMQEGARPEVPKDLVSAFGRVLEDRSLDPLLAGEALILPSEGYLAQRMAVVDPDAIHTAREQARLAIATAYRATLEVRLDELEDPGPYRPEPEAIGRRRLRNLVLGYLMALEEEAVRARCLTQFREAGNMTDTMAALSLLANCHCPQRSEALEAFYTRWRGEPLVVDKWFSIQATSQLPGTLETVRALLEHPAFDIRTPNRVRALIGAFSQGNQVRFHGADGGGYDLLAEQVMRLDPLNPQVAARMVSPLSRWRRFDPQRGARMREALERIANHGAISKDLYEVVSKSLEA